MKMNKDRYTSLLIYGIKFFSIREKKCKYKIKEVKLCNHKFELEITV